MKVTKDMPQSGQFIAIWKYADAIWSSTLCFQNGVLYMFLPVPGGFTLLNPEHPLFGGTISFVILEEGDEDYVADKPTIH